MNKSAIRVKRKRLSFVSFRLTDEQSTKLDQACEIKEKSKSELLRDLLMPEIERIVEREREK